MRTSSNGNNTFIDAGQGAINLTYDGNTTIFWGEADTGGNNGDDK